MTFSVLQGDCLDLMPMLGENSVDSIVTDPPYGLSFMGKDWDHGVPGVHFWQEALKVLKPGGYLLAFGGTRTFHRLAVAVEDAGFEMRDTLMWVYGSGFPKSHNGPWGGTALKPDYEPLLLARKPLVGTVAANVLAHGTGGLNIDGCRVGDEVLPEITAGQAKLGTFERGVMVTPERVGRWPANLLHDGSDEVLALFPDTQRSVRKATEKEYVPNGKNTVFGTGMEPAPHAGFDDVSGSAARFFYCSKASKADRDEGLDDAPDRVLAMSNQAKAEQAKGNLHQGEGGMNTGKVRKNHHPTVKPTDLMRYLCRLITPPGGIVLDPFTGSGSTGKAAVLEGFGFIGCELQAEYVEIALARIGAVTK